MPSYVYRDGHWVNKSTGLIDPPRYPGQICKFQINTSDETPPLISGADGKTYTSKAAMRASYKASNNPRGMDFVEVGNDPVFTGETDVPKPTSKIEDVAVAVEKAEAAISRGEFDHIQ